MISEAWHSLLPLTGMRLVPAGCFGSLRLGLVDVCKAGHDLANHI